MGSGTLLTIGSLLFITSLVIVYFKKKYIPSIENKIFRSIIILNLFGVILHLMIFLFMISIGTDNNITVIVSKLYLVYLVSWITLFTLYVFIISLKNKNNIEKVYRKSFNISLIIVIVVSIIMFILPIQFHSEVGKMYSYGPAVNVVYVVSVVSILFAIICLLTNVKQVISKKYIPLFAYLVIGAIATFVQFNSPWIQLITSLETFVVYLMYFTIENPDMKMLEEVHKAKEISDNANEEKTMFLYNMTGEIRSITKDIDIYADNILNESDNKNQDIELIKDNAREIKSSTAKFTKMTNEILDISSIDSSNIKIYNKKYNIKLLIKEIITSYKKKCEEHNIEFRTNVASDIPEYLYGDNIGLKKSISVLLDNSVKNTNNGYIEFNIDTIKKNDIVRLIISIQDSAKNIKIDDIDKMFKDKNLSIAKDTIGLMNGTIIPSASLDKGTTMKIVLDQQIAEVEKEVNKYDNIYDKKKILLVDDNESSIKIISKLLNDTNIVLDVVNSAKECLDKIRNKEKYNLIITEEILSPIDGKELVSKLKEIRNFNTKVILLTKDNNYEYNDDYLNYGFDDYILKPIDKDKLLEKISK